MLTLALSATYTFVMARRANPIPRKAGFVKHLLLFCALASVAALSPAAEAPSLTGKWQVEISISGNDSQQTCSFTQTGAELTGSCESERGKVEIGGKIEGKNVTWMYKSEYNGSPLTVNYRGTWDSAGKIAGTVEVPEFGVEGGFAATPVK